MRKPLPHPVLSYFRAANRNIVSIDGEGYDIDGTHSYTLIAAADDRGFSSHLWHDGSRGTGDNITHKRNNGLTTEAILDWLFTLRRTDGDVFVSFSFSYDAVKILSDLPHDTLEELADADAMTSVRWGKYAIDYLPRKWFSVSIPSSGKIKTADGSFRYRKFIKVNDAFGFFQQSFKSALDSSTHLFTESDMTKIETIGQMKDQRSNFSDDQKPEILAYCLDECRYLSIMMRDIMVNIEHEGLLLKSFHGSSAMSGAWLKREKVDTFRGSAGIPDDILNAGYYGGRFEIKNVGYIGKGYTADINSAYPSEMVNLPCLAHATSRRVTEFESGKRGIYLVGSETKGDWAPFPIRVDKFTAKTTSGQYRNSFPSTMSKFYRDLFNRQVLFAHGGKRWVWNDEVEAAIKWNGAAAIPIYDGYVIDINCDCELPLREIAELYAERARIKKTEPGRQMMLKILINACYGKLAQSIGGERALFHCRAWAGMITSGTRAKVYDAVMASNGTAVSIATDGIITTEPLQDEAFNHSKKLGEWERGEYRNVRLYQSGIYTYDELKDDGTRKLDQIKSRGFSPKDITVTMLKNAWDGGRWSVSASSACRKCGALWDELQHGSNGPGTCPSCSELVPIPRGFIGLKIAMKRKRQDRLRLMGEWVPNNKVQNFVPSKRVIVGLALDPFATRPDSIGTEPYSLPLIDGEPPMSHAYVPHSDYSTRNEAMEMFGDMLDIDAPEVEYEDD